VIPSEASYALHESRMRRLDQEELSAKKFGSKQLYMHLSALSPTTRKSHAERHGKLFTAKQVREFWSDPSNIEGCKCGVVVVLVDDLGKPIVPQLLDRARETYKKMAARGYEWSQ